MRCGVGDYTALLAEALGRHPDLRVGVLTDARAGESRTEQHVQVLPIVHGWGISKFRQVLKMIEDWSPDIVHIQYPTQGYGQGLLPWFLPVLLALKRIPTVQTWHEHFPMGSYRWSLPLAITPGGLIVV